MASATILGYATGSGEWGSYGFTGWWIRNAVASVSSSYPAAVASVTCAEGDAINLTAGDSRAMRIAAGSGAASVLQTSGGGNFVMTVAATSESAAYTLSLRLISLSASRVYTITVKTADGVTTLATGTTPDALLGVWARLKLVGSVRIEVSGTFPRYQGVLFDPGTSDYSDQVLGGLASGGDWPPSLATSQSAWAGIEVGVGSGLDPSLTLVEDAVAGLDVGGDWPPALATAIVAWAGIEIGGDWTAAQGSDPRTLREAIFHRLKSSATLAAVVGANIHHARLPQEAPLPAVVFNAPARSYGHNLSGGDGTSSATVQIDCWGTAPDQCEAAATAVRLAFQGFRGSIGLVQFMGCFVDDVGDTVERDSPGSDAWTYRTIITIEARHRVSIPAQEA